MEIVELLGYTYNVNNFAEDIKNSFEELVLVTRLMGYTIYHDAKLVIFKLNNSQVFRIFFRCKRFKNLEQVEFIINDKNLEHQLQKKFNKTGKIRQGGYKISFIIKDFEELSKVFRYITEII